MRRTHLQNPIMRLEAAPEWPDRGAKGCPGWRCWDAKSRRRHRIGQIDPRKQPYSLAALSASHHQMAGNKAIPYSGIFSGLPKRSQRAVRSFP